MKFTIPTLMAATLASTPSFVNAWVCGPGFYGLANPLILSSPELRQQQKEMLRRQQILANRMGLQRSSPRYEITNNEDKFQVAVDVPGVKMEDIDVTLENEGAVLSISGVRKASDDSYSFSSKFAQSFSLDQTVDVDKFTASLKNGVLVVSAPKDIKRIEDNIRKIAVTEINDEETLTDEIAAENSSVRAEKDEGSEKEKSVDDDSAPKDGSDTPKED